MKVDRRAARTRELLQGALIGLIGERRYDAITIQDIVDRADVGRTTFYLHYTSKDDLFLRCHETVIGGFHFGPHHPLSREELLSPEVSPGTLAAYRHLGESKGLLHRFFGSKDGVLLLERIRDERGREIEANLRATFAGYTSAIPLDIVANYVAGAQLALIHWWAEGRQSHTPESLAQASHRLQRAAIREAFGL